jgi:squalene-associated FAD-dependent desaturase
VPETGDVAVIGAGWAGLAAAVTLVESGLRPVLIDAAPQAGGRARGVTIQAPGGDLAVDNGQHLLVGAYRHVLSLLATIGVDVPQVLRRRPLRLLSTDGLRLSTTPLPAPLHLALGLLRARGLGHGERTAMVRLMLGLRLRGWQVSPGETVAELLATFRQPPRLVERLWEPLCVAALNTPVEEACARTFAHVLRDTLGAAREASDFLIPADTLTQVLPAPAMAWLQQRGTAIRLRTPARAITASGHGWAIETGGGVLRCRTAIVAVPPVNAARLLSRAIDKATLTALERFTYEPIATAYLCWRGADLPTLPEWTMLVEAPDSRGYGQWLFDRGSAGGQRLAAVVVSARGRQFAAAAADLSGEPPVEAPSGVREAIAAGIARQVGAQLGTRPPDIAHVLIDRRATFRCVPDRPVFTATSLASHAPGLFLAGDYAWPDYPATLESAVASGQAAARACAGSD